MQQLKMKIRQGKSMRICVAPLQDPYAEASPTRAERKITVFSSWWNWEHAPFGRCLRSEGSPL